MNNLNSFNNSHNNLSQFESNYLKKLERGEIISEKDLQKIFDQANDLFIDQNKTTKKSVSEYRTQSSSDPSFFKLFSKKKEGKTEEALLKERIISTINQIAVNHLDKNMRATYQPEVANQVISYLIQSQQGLRSRIINTADYQSAIKMAGNLDHFYQLVSNSDLKDTYQSTPAASLYKVFKEKFLDDQLKNAFNQEQQTKLLEGTARFLENIQDLSEGQHSLDYLHSHLDWICQNLYGAIHSEEHITSAKLKQLLTILCEHPRFENSRLENSLVPMHPKEFEKHLSKLGASQEFEQMWKEKHIGSLMHYYHHHVYYSHSLNQYFMKYQGEYVPLFRVWNKIEEEFKKGNQDLYYTEEGVVHYDPEKSVEIRPLITREAVTQDDTKHKLVIISVGAKEKGLSDPGHAWIRLEEPFEQDGKHYVRVYSIGFFLRGLILAPDKFEFTPRERVETSFEISPAQFSKNFEMIKLFRLYSHQKTSMNEEKAKMFDSWIQGDCVEFAVEMAVLSNVDENWLSGKDKRVDRMIEHKKQATDDKPTQASGKSKNAQKPQILDRLKLPIRALLYGDPAIMREWQKQLIDAQLPLKSQTVPEKRLTNLSIL